MSRREAARTFVQRRRRDVDDNDRRTQLALLTGDAALLGDVQLADVQVAQLLDARKR